MTQATTPTPQPETMIGFGAHVKALGDGRVGGHLVLFGSPEAKDFDGMYFTSETDFGTHAGNGARVMLHHGQPIKTGNPDVDRMMAGFPKSLKGKLTTEKQALGIWAETILDMSDDYERQVYELAEKGALKWSSGTAEHVMDVDPNGFIKTWDIVEGSLTPTPAEPRMLGSKVLPLKALVDPSATHLEGESHLENQNGTTGVTDTGAIAGAKSVERDVPPHSDPAQTVGTSKTPLIIPNMKIGALKMLNLELIAKLVPGLSQEQLDALAAAIELAEGTVDATMATEDPEDPEDPEDEADALMANVQKAMKKLGIEAPTARPAYAAGAPVKSTEGDTPKDYTKSVHILRYGNPDSAVKAVLTDLHGNDYEAKRDGQWNAFKRYLRGGENALKSGDYDLLKQVVFTPELATKAIQEGVDVRSLKATMVEAVDTLGGYVVPVDFQNTVIDRLQGLTVLRGRANQITTSRDRVEIPKATGGDDQYTSAVRFTWVDETPTAGASETNLTFGLESVPVHTLMAETPLSRNFVEDSAVDIASYLAGKFAEVAIAEDNTFLTGDGVGKPQGMLPGSANSNSISEENSGDASALTWDGLIGLVHNVPSQYRNNAVFIMERGTVEAIRKLKDSNFGYMWQPYQYAGGQDGQPPRLLGYPVLEQEAMPSIAANAFPVLFGDPAGYTIVDRVGMTVERYLDSQTARQNLVYFVMRRRVGGQLTEAYRWAVQKVAV